MGFPARPASIVLWLSLMAALFGPPALAADTGNGSKNFHAPAAVPNYFSNEAGPIIGGAAETRRGELYGAAAPAAGASRSHVAVASVPQRAARVAAGRSRTRGRHEAHSTRKSAAAHPKLAAAHTKPRAHAAAHTTANAHAAARATTRASASHATAKTTKVGSNHRRGRG